MTQKTEEAKGNEIRLGILGRIRKYFQSPDKLGQTQSELPKALPKIWYHTPSYNPDPYPEEFVDQVSFDDLSPENLDLIAKKEFDPRSMIIFLGNEQYQIRFGPEFDYYNSPGKDIWVNYWINPGKYLDNGKKPGNRRKLEEVVLRLNDWSQLLSYHEANGGYCYNPLQRNLKLRGGITLQEIKEQYPEYAKKLGELSIGVYVPKAKLKDIRDIGFAHEEEKRIDGPQPHSRYYY